MGEPLRWQGQPVFCSLPQSASLTAPSAEGAEDIFFRRSEKTTHFSSLAGIPKGKILCYNLDREVYPCPGGLPERFAGGRERRPL